MWERIFTCGGTGLPIDNEILGDDDICGICCIMRVPLKFSFNCLVLHLYKNIKKNDRILPNSILIAAKMLITKKWWLGKVPTLMEWQMKCQYISLQNSDPKCSWRTTGSCI